MQAAYRRRQSPDLGRGAHRHYQPRSHAHHPAPQPQSPHTARAYAADWQAFAAWCAAAGQSALPAASVTVAAHLESLAGRLGSSGRRRRLAAIADQHRRSGQPWNPAQPEIRATLRQFIAGHAAPARPAAALGEAALRPPLASCNDDVAGQRDRALFLLVQATVLRRAALLALDCEHLRLIPGGLTITDTGRRTRGPLA